MNLRGIRRELEAKEISLKSARRVLGFFLKSPTTNDKAIKEVQQIIKELEIGIAGLKREIERSEKSAKKKS